MKVTFSKLTEAITGVSVEICLTGTVNGIKGIYVLAPPWGTVTDLQCPVAVHCQSIFINSTIYSVKSMKLLGIFQFPHSCISENEFQELIVQNR